MKMNIVKDVSEIEKIVDWRKKLSYGGLKILNTPWAKNKNTGERDIKNLAVFVEVYLKETPNNKMYWLISDVEVKEIFNMYYEIKRRNMDIDNEGKKFVEENGDSCE
jgi:hypothetical protein